MKKQFKLRLVKTSDATCYVEYSYHWFFPKWNKIEKWMDMLRTWGTVVSTYEEAKEFAKRFKSIEDVNAWKEEQEVAKVKYPAPNYDVPVIEYLDGGQQ